ncbi:MAG: hypothetical protein ACI93P_000754, partial [bacterium]
MKKITLNLLALLVTVSLWQVNAQTEISQASATLDAGIDFVDGDIYVDSGGSLANYSSSEFSTLTLNAEVGETVTVTFTTFEVEASSFGSCWDNLTVTGDAGGGDATYAGDSSDAGAGLSCTDATDPAGNPTLGPFTSAVGGSLDFLFDSDTSGQFSGWTATISLSSAGGGGGGSSSSTFCSTETPLPIDPPALVSTFAAVASTANPGDTGMIGAGLGEYTISSVDLNIQSGWANDLTLELQSPSGSKLLLSDGNGDSGLSTAADLIFVDGGA